MPSELWQRIRRIRTHLGETQEVFGARFGVSKASVAQWESKNPDNRTKPELQKQLAIARTVGAPVNWLVEDESDLNDKWWDYEGSPVRDTEGVPHDVIASEAAKLQKLFSEHTDFTREEFADKFGLGSGKVVSEYLSGRRPLSIEAAHGFSQGLHVPIESFSPRLQIKLREMYELLIEEGEEVLRDGYEKLTPEEEEMLKREDAELRRPPKLSVGEPGITLDAIDLPNQVPLISWVAAGHWDEAFDPYAPGAAEEWVSVPGRHSRDAVALRVRGDEGDSHQGHKVECSGGDRRRCFE